LRVVSGTQHEINGLRHEILTQPLTLGTEHHAHHVPAILPHPEREGGEDALTERAPLPPGGRDIIGRHGEIGQPGPMGHQAGGDKAV
jgi:hypothetical protein